MKVPVNSRAITFAKILAFCTDYMDAKDIAKAIHSTEMTSRKYMKILVDAGYVDSVSKSAKLKSMRKIKTIVDELPEITLLDLCEKYRNKFAKETITANSVRKAKKIAAQAELIEINKSKVIGTVDKTTGARIVRATEYHWTRPERKSGRGHAIGSSMSMVIASGNY